MTEESTQRFHVVTGGPGAGKTTLVEALGRQGLACAPEAGRAIIRDQMAIGGPALPWSDPALYAELMLAFELRSWRQALAMPGPVLFDRGLPDVIGYRRLTGLAVPAHLTEAARLFRYHATAFIAPPWPAIFTRDRERRQDFVEAVRTHDAMVEAWQGCGYALVPLPLAPVEARVRFVLERIARHPVADG